MAVWIGHENRVLTATLTANSQVASLPVQNLQTPHGDTGSAWQTPPGTTGANVTIDSGSPDATWRLFAIARTNLTDAAVVRWRVGTLEALNGTETLAYDSGNLTTMVAPGYGQSVHVAPVEVTGQYCRFSILNGSNPDGFLSVAQAFAGPGYQPTGISYQSTWQRDASRDLIETRGGQEFDTLRFARRSWDAQFPSLPTGQVYPEVAEAMRVAERGRNILFVPFSTSSDINRDAVFGRMLPQGVGFMNGAGLRRTWRARFVERL